MPRAQHDPRRLTPVGGAEPVREVAHAGRVGTAEGEGGRIGIREPQDGDPATGDQPQQVDLGGIRVGQFVDVDMPVELQFPAMQCGLVDEEGGSGPDELGLVVCRAAARARVAQVQDLLVLVHEPRGGDPVRPALLKSEPGEIARADAPLGRPQHQSRAVRREGAGTHGVPQRVRPPDPPLGVRIGEQVADDGVLLRARQQARRGLVRLGGRVPQQAEGVRREGAHDRFGHGRRPRRTVVATESHLKAVAQRSGGPTPEREDENPARLHPLGDPRRDRLDQRGRLAGAGTADDQQRPGPVGDHRQLGLVQCRRHLDRPTSPHQRVARKRSPLVSAGPGHPLFGHHCHTAMQPRAPDGVPHRHGPCVVGQGPLGARPSPERPLWTTDRRYRSGGLPHPYVRKSLSVHPTSKRPQ